MAEEYLKGQKVTRDPKTGRFVSVQLTSERASEIKTLDKVKSADQLLKQAGYDPPSSADEHLKLLASIAASKRTGSVAALRDFRKLTGLESKPEKKPEKPGLAAEWIIKDLLVNVEGKNYVVLTSEVAQLLREKVKAARAASGGETSGNGDKFLNLLQEVE